jgi:uncharacterized protein (TIGR02996 family)
VLDALLQAVVEDPQAEDRWLVLADWLEENDDLPRAEFLRLHRQMLATCTEPERHPERAGQQERLVELLAEGVRPCVPQQTVALGDGPDMTFVWIAPGTFLMGSLPDDLGRDPDEGPQHKVTLTQGFWLGTTPVTQAQWHAVMGSTPSDFRGKTRPVDCVSWFDCQELCRQLESRANQRFRLPTEAEWEHACRAGTTTPYITGSDLEALKLAGWCSYNGNLGSARRTKPVGRFLPNFWGLFDMHGNVWEWCADWCDEEYYEHSPAVDPQGPEDGFLRILRGGSWWEEPRFSRSSHRCWYDPDAPYNTCGFRLVLCPD